MVFLDVDQEVLRRRVSARPGHFFPRALLESQLATLEKPSPGAEPRVRVITVADHAPPQIAAAIIAAVRPNGMPEPATGAG
jgi:gluconokinase